MSIRCHHISASVLTWYYPLEKFCDDIGRKEHDIRGGRFQFDETLVGNGWQWSHKLDGAGRSITKGAHLMIHGSLLDDLGWDWFVWWCVTRLEECRFTRIDIAKDIPGDQIPALDSAIEGGRIQGVPEGLRPGWVFTTSRVKTVERHANVEGETRYFGKCRSGLRTCVYNRRRDEAGERITRFEVRLYKDKANSCNTNLIQSLPEGIDLWGFGPDAVTDELSDRVVSALESVHSAAFQFNIPGYSLNSSPSVLTVDNVTDSDIYRDIRWLCDQVGPSLAALSAAGGTSVLDLIFFYCRERINPLVQERIRLALRDLESKGEQGASEFVRVFCRSQQGVEQKPSELRGGDLCG